MKNNQPDKKPAKSIREAMCWLHLRIIIKYPGTGLHVYLCSVGLDYVMLNILLFANHIATLVT